MFLTYFSSEFFSELKNKLRRKTRRTDHLANIGGTGLLRKNKTPPAERHHLPKKHPPGNERASLIISQDVSNDIW